MKPGSREPLEGGEEDQPHQVGTERQQGLPHPSAPLPCSGSPLSRLQTSCCMALGKSLLRGLCFLICGMGCTLS